MKKYLSMMGSLLLGLLLITSCDKNDDDNNAPELERKYLKVENATYMEGAMPAATIHETPIVQAPSTVSKGGSAIIRVARDRNYVRYYISVKDVPGYYVYTPNANGRATRSDDDEWDEIPFTVPTDGDGSTTILTSGEDDSGNVTEPYYTEITYVDGLLVRLKSISTEYGSTQIMGFTYDKQNRLASWDIYPDGVTDVNYHQDGSITITSDDGDLVYQNVQTDNDGHVTFMHCNDGDGYSDNITFSYDEEGHLTKWTVSGSDSGERFSSTATLTWEDGSISKFVFTDSDGDDIVYTFTYNGHNNNSGQTFYTMTNLDGFPIGTNLFGLSTKKLPSAVSINGVITTMEFTFNESGCIKTQKVQRNGKSATYKYDYYE